MPSRHIYEGDCGLQFERIYASIHDPIPTAIECDCGGHHSAEILWELPKKRYAYVRPITYYENAKGEIRVPTDPSDPNPGKGWQKKETGLMNEISQLEKRINQQEMSKGSRFREVSHIQALAKQKAEREHLYNGDYVPVRETEDGEIEYKFHPGFNHWSEQGKDFARAAMEESNSRLAKETRSIDPGMFFGFMHNDAKKR